MKKIFMLFIISMVISCGRKDTLPEGYMNEEQMVTVLIDIHTAQAAIQQLRLTTDSSAYLFKVFEQQILKEAQAKDTLFYKSYSWYLEHPQKMFEIYTAVVDTISLRESLSRHTE